MPPFLHLPLTISLLLLIFPSSLAGQAVFLVAATLRPETMYGQTNCWLHPDINYIAFRVKSGEVFVSTRRAALNMAYQDFTAEFGKIDILLNLKGEVICIQHV